MADEHGASPTVAGSSTPAGRRVVLGIGNILSRDEGLGIHALRAVQMRLGEGAVELVDGGVQGLSLLPLVEECSHLLVLDAVDRGLPAGSVVELSRDEIPLFAGVKMSQHQVTFQEVLGLAAIRGRLPSHLHLVGAQPWDLGIGLDTSRMVSAAIPAVVDRALSVLGAWGLAVPAPVQASPRDA